MLESKEETTIINEVYIRNNSIIKIDNIYTISKSTLLIKYENIVGTGFFIKFMKINNKSLYFLMTNEHVITSKMIENEKSIDIIYENKTKKFTIKLKKDERIIKTFIDMNIDATIVEILPKDKIKEDYFLTPYDEEDYDYENLINKEIQIVQFPKGGNLSLSKGKIINIDLNGKYRFSYDASTRSGSSGSPIILYGEEKVIGLHKGGNASKRKNYGDLIGPINTIIKQLRKNGKRIEYYQNGNKKYEGNFLDDEYEEDGTFYYENGDIYIGKFKNGKKEGDGIIVDSDGNIKEEGTYKNNKLINDNNEENLNYRNDYKNKNNNNNESGSENEMKEEYKKELKRKEIEEEKEEEKKINNKDIFNFEMSNNSKLFTPNNFGLCNQFYRLINNLPINCTCGHLTDHHNILGNNKYFCLECRYFCEM